MNKYKMKPMYDFSARGLRSPSGFKRHVDHAVREIQEVVGSDPGLQIHVEKETNAQGFFTLSISADLFGRSITVRRRGKRMFSLLKQAKKTLLRIFRRSMSKKIKSKRQPIELALAS